MLSQNLHSAIGREIVGQPRAVRTICRAVTVALSGLDSGERALGTYLLAGASGTGKTHLARSLAKVLHGHPTRRLVSVDCTQLPGHHEWAAFARWVEPLFSKRIGEGRLLGCQPLSILVIEQLEAARPEFVRGLIATIETGQVILDDGVRGSLRGALVLLTTGLCSREVYEAGKAELGFSAAAPDLDESEKARIYQASAAAVEKRWGGEFFSHLDDLIIFHRLREQHLHAIVERLLRELNQQLAPRRVTCELDPSAGAFLVARGTRFLQHGAWFLLKIFRRFVVFPVSDLLTRGAASGTRVRITLDGGERLRFEAFGLDAALETRIVPDGGAAEIPVDWQIV